MRHLTKLRPHGILHLDDRLIIKIVKDLVLYDYVPSLNPMKNEVIQASVQINAHRMTHKSGLTDRLRELYSPLIARFWELFDPEELDDLKAYIKARWKLDVKGIALPESPC